MQYGSMFNEYAIATSQLTKRYDRAIAVNEVDLRVKPGEIYGLMGINGAGKTSLVKMLAGIEIPTKGEIHYHGDRLLNDRNNRIKRYLGYLPDNYPVYEDLTVWDYLDYFGRLYQISPRRRRVRICEVLDIVSLEEKHNSLIPTLSRGMKQRLSLARAIIHEPTVLILDEPVSGLDTLARQQFNLIIRSLQEAGMTILIASPILRDLTELCTTIGVMDRGFLIDTMTMQQLKEYQATQQIIVSTLGELKDLKQALETQELVTHWEKLPEKNALKVSFVGTEADSAKLLRFLVTSQLPIIEFNYTQEDWETIILNRRQGITHENRI